MSLVVYDETKPFTVLLRKNQLSAAGRTHSCRGISLELKQIVVLERFFCFEIDRFPTVTRNVHRPTYWLDDGAFLHGKHERANHGVAKLHRLASAGLLFRLRLHGFVGSRSTSRCLSGAGDHCPTQNRQNHPTQAPHKGRAVGCRQLYLEDARRALSSNSKTGNCSF